MRKRGKDIRRLRFYQHRENAAKRGIEFKMSFDEWWRVWQESGHWKERGLGSDKYCMCRVGDHGAYEAGNVFIATHAENVASAVPAIYPDKKLPMGVREQKGSYYATKQIKGIQYHIGTFRTPEFASAAYKNFVPVASASVETQAGEDNDARRQSDKVYRGPY